MDNFFEREFQASKCFQIAKLFLVNESYIPIGFIYSQSPSHFGRKTTVGLIQLLKERQSRAREGINSQHHSFLPLRCYFVQGDTGGFSHSSQFQTFQYKM